MRVTSKLAIKARYVNQHLCFLAFCVRISKQLFPMGSSKEIDKDKTI